MTQPEAMKRAIKLALRLEGFGQNEAAAELRRLHEVNQELLVALKNIKKNTDGRLPSHIGQARSYAIASETIAKAEGEAK